MILKQSLVIATVIAGLIVTGCIHSGTSDYANNDMTSFGRRADRAPAEFVLENQATFLNPTNVEVFLNEKDEKIDCQKILTRTETFNGKSYMRFNISKTDFLACPQVKAMSTQRVWKVKKATWESADELAYQNFIKQMAKSGCNTADKCLSGPGNILRTEEDMLNVFYTDCADFPYYLRAYFAYKTNLPMSFVMEIRQAPYTDAQLTTIEAERAAVLKKDGEDGLSKYDKQLRDQRYSRNGNIPVSRVNIPSSSVRARDFGVIAPQIVNIISSGFLRMSSAPADGKVQPDFYSPAITQDNIKAGTVLYQVAGHVAVVYEVTPKGEVLFMDAHPDNSISRGSFNLEYKPLRVAYGGNFKNFRPIKVVNPQYDSSGVIVAGTVKVASDSEIPQFSYEQYNGDGIDSSGRGIYKLKPSDKKSADFHDWVKYRLSAGAYRLDPVSEMKSEVDSLCLAAQDRVIAIQEAVDNAVHLKPHPSNLPQNIYGTEGEWESYSSPGRDLRLRSKILSIPEAAANWIARYKAGDNLVSYPGTNLKGDLILSYQAAANACRVSYKNSMGTTTTVSLDKIINRVALISYDPYMCPEIRWGANSPEELATCKDDATKREWHQLQQFFRNTLEKDTTGVHGYSLQQLRQMNSSRQVNNTNTSGNYNILTKLQAL